MGQPWLANDHNPFVTTISPALNGHTVSSLMCKDRREWDEEVLTDLFNDRDQQCIRSIVLSESDNEDCLYWSKESTGLYTVRSAYKLLQMQKNL